jgi:hypothetical protein
MLLRDHVTNPNVHVHLLVSDLEKSTAFYVRRISARR